MLQSPLTPALSGPSELEIRRRLTLEEEKDDVTSTTMDSSDKYTRNKVPPIRAGPRGPTVSIPLVFILFVEPTTRQV